MELKFRNGKGNMFAKMKGHLALAFLEAQKSSHYFRREIKNSRSGIQSQCLVCQEHIKLGAEGNMEIWMEPGDYIEIVI